MSVSPELEHEDAKDIRNALLTAEWGAPIAILAAVIPTGWLNTLLNVVGIGLFLYAIYRLIHETRADYDMRLKQKRLEIINLLKSRSSQPTTP